VTPGLL